MHTRRPAPTIQHLFSALVALLLLVPFARTHPAPVRAATDTVTNCNTSGPGSLPAVLAAANMDDTITFDQDCATTNAITLTGLLEPAENVTINATSPPHTITISGNNSVRLFLVNRGITLGLSGLTLVNGLSGEGGAILNYGTVNLMDSTFTGNTATSRTSGGGAIGNSGTMNVMNCTFTGNAATKAAGGAIGNNGTLNIVGSTFVDNTANDNQYPGTGGAISSSGPLRLALSIVAGNTAVNGPDIHGDVTDGGGNVVGNTTDSTGLAGYDDKLNKNALLAFLTGNGGLVQTFALLPGSPAIAIASCTYFDGNGMTPTLATDARGARRPQTANCDAGSYQTPARPQLFASATHAATDTVTNCADSGPGSLPDVFAAASANDTIIFAQDCTGPNAIVLTSTFTPTVNVTIDATAPLHAVTISGGKAVRLFFVNGNITLGLRGLILADGNGGNASGGAIITAGTVNIDGSTFSSNSGYNGGAIFIFDGNVNITESTFEGNTSISRDASGGGHGGAIANRSALNLVRSTFSGNTARGDLLSGSTANGTSGFGGAIFNFSSGTANVVNSTFFNNSLKSNWGGGGAIYNNHSALTVVGSTFSGNFAPNILGGYGGAIGNSQGTLWIAFSILAGNTAYLSPDLYGPIIDGGGNVVGDTLGIFGLTATSDKPNVDPMLAPLINNGGTVQTFALMSGSPAIAIAACPIDTTTGMTFGTDARGAPRPQGANCDAGSYQTSTRPQASLVSDAANGGTLSGNTR